MDEEVDYIPKVGDRVVLKKTNNRNWVSMMDRFDGTTQVVEAIIGEHYFFKNGGPYNLESGHKDCVNSWSWRAKDNYMFISKSAERKLLKLRLCLYQ